VPYLTGFVVRVTLVGELGFEQALLA